VEAKRDGSLAGFVGHACGAVEGREIIRGFCFFGWRGWERDVDRSEEIYEAGLFWSGLNFGSLTINSQSIKYSAIAFIYTILAIAH
jgi:hypothetical protein